MKYSDFIKSLNSPVTSAVAGEVVREEIVNDSYDELDDGRIATIIKEHYDVKVTNTLIESYKELAASNIFTIDPIVQQIRTLNKLDSIIEGKIHYTLADGTLVAINETTQKQLNTLLQNQQEIIEYMRESKSNFFHVLKKIKE